MTSSSLTILAVVCVCGCTEEGECRRLADGRDAQCGVDEMRACGCDDDELSDFLSLDWRLGQE